MLKNQPKQLLGSLLLYIAFPDSAAVGLDKKDVVAKKVLTNWFQIEIELTKKQVIFMVIAK